MSKRNMIIAGIVIVVVAIGLLVYMSKHNTPAGGTNAQQGTASSTQVQAQEVSVGTGAQAKPGDTVSVLYVGQLQDGTVFDSSAAHDNQPLTFVLGAQGLIPGFQIGVNGMKEGGERLMAIPPTLGYGSQDVKDGSGKVVIPANSTIIFDVKLVKVTAGTSTSAQ
ncbi:MAG TPA: FKBP-type peptidyl-prolyl cis-trans isomerase [Candidatus Paceibacterota bacterium]|nr:FKBP-type peptidyl-prolyl cis-trans isomerase [Candidatus Paceibacterota bacterium]